LVPLLSLNICHIHCSTALPKHFYLLHISGNPRDRPNPFSQMDYTALRTYAMLVNQPPTFVWDSNVPRHAPARHFVSWFQFMGEVISDTYNAGLSSVLASPR
jgi:hypothetical protein